MSKLNEEIVNAVKEIATKTAIEFFNEFHDSLDSSETDWDTEAWGVDCYVVEEIDELADYADYWEIYSNTLEIETNRLLQNYLASYNFETETWTSTVDCLESLDQDSYQGDCDIINYPVLTICAKNYFVYDTDDTGEIILDELNQPIEVGVVDETPSDREIIAKLPVLPSNLCYEIGGWSPAEEEYVVCTVRVGRKRTSLAEQLAQEYGLEVVKA